MVSDPGREIAEKRRKERLEAALRVNLKQRKAQQRARLAKTGETASGPKDPGARAAPQPAPSGND
jgi:hypothetical protein